MAAKAFGDANENGNFDNNLIDHNDRPNGSNRDEHSRRRSTKHLAQPAPCFNSSNSNPHHSYVFKEFTKSSLINVERSRRNVKLKKNSSSYLDPTKEEPEPDPYLASGQQLPPALVRQLPDDLIGRPIEDLDPYYADQGTFVIISRGKELTRFSASKALYLFGPFHPIRRVVLYILVNPIFNLLVILTILINCILMTLKGSDTEEKTEIFFTIVYTTEMCLKVLARGFIVNKFTYLRDPWNWLDFTVIIMAYLTIVVEDLGNLSVMRTFRVLRALKTVAIIPGMKTIVGAVIDSVKNLKDVVVLTLFSLSVFSLLGLQIYMGILTQKCVLNGPNNMTDWEWFEWASNSSHWIPEPDEEIFGQFRLCGNATGAQSCPENHTCLQGFGGNPDYGYTNFDTFGWSLICSFRMMTQDFWEGLYAQILKTAGSWHIIFFIVSMFLGSIYLMNLILAIVAMSYNELQRRAEEEEEAAAEDEAAFLESCRQMEMQEQMSEFSSTTMGMRRTSYRPSVEIGLVGQSLLASLCQNGLLGQHVREKLNQQMILPGVVPNEPPGPSGNNRSHSLCLEVSPDEEEPAAAGKPALERPLGGLRQEHQPTSGPRQTSLMLTTPVASSMTELRRKSSLMLGRGLNFSKKHSSHHQLSQSQQQHPARHQRLSPQTVHKQVGLVGSSSSSEQPEAGPHQPVSKQPERLTGNLSARSSTTSDRDLCLLRQKAALIRIVSDDCSVPSQAKSSTTTTTTTDQINKVTLTPQEQAINAATSKGARQRTGSGFYDEDFRRSSLASNRSHKATSASQQFLSVERGGAKDNSHDYSPNRDFGAYLAPEESELTETGRPSFGSEVAICQQPKSENKLALGSSGKQLAELSRRHAASNNALSQTGAKEDRQQLFGVQSFPVGRLAMDAQAGSQRPAALKRNSLRISELNNNKEQLEEQQQSGNPRHMGLYQQERYRLLPGEHSRMHHLSVENFQQFGLLKSSNSMNKISLQHQNSQTNSAGSSSAQHSRPQTGQAQQVSVDSSNDISEASEFSAAEPLGQPRFGRGRLESRAYIHPSTMMRNSFARPRHSIVSARLPAFSQPASGGPQSGSPSTGLTASNARRVSQDFVRRASDWSRLSMSGNVDLRRLLRLWAHTNPYQGRPSVSSFHSQYSSNNYNPALAEGLEQVSGRDSPAHSVVYPSSPRPSSVGSTRQAYEFISAYNRRYNDNRPWNAGQPVAPGYEGLAGNYSLPLDDNDKISINARDKCLAYCLSCLDILCIWECCGAWLKIQRIISLIVFDPFTELFIILCILINTLFMALDSDDADASMKTIFERGNYFFTATFAVEATMKIVALSPKFYFREGWNVFDAIIVGLSLLELGLEGVYGLSVLRSFRLLRVFKLAKSWPTLNLLISIMGKAVGDLGNLTFVLAIIVFIFAVMGMQLFGNKYIAHNFPSGELPRWNFNDFMHSFMIVFRILCAEWIEPMWDCLLVGSWPCIPFFLIAVTVGNLVVLNLFLALLLASFGASNLSSPQADNVDTRKLQEAIARFSRFGNWFKWRLNELVRAYIFCRGRSSLANQATENVPHLARGSDGNYFISSTDFAAHGGTLKVGSHIAAMSKMERLRNIEARTEELKSKIRRSPEHHYHLRQLAKSHLRESSQSLSQLQRSLATTSGYNYHYQHKTLPLVNSSGRLMAPIPIIVDEADGESEGAHSPSTGTGGERTCGREGSASPAELIRPESQQVAGCSASEQHPESPTSNAHESVQQQQPSSWPPARFCALNMQPIKEDSRDADSTQSEGEAGKRLSSFESRNEPEHQRELDQQRRQELPITASSRQLEGSNEDSALREKLLGEQQSRRDSGELAGQQNEPEEEPKSSMYLRAPKREDMEEEDEKTLQHIESYIESCICLGILCLKWFLFRQYVRRIVEHRYFDQCILILIVISSGTLALEDKHLNERPNLKWTLDILDTIFTVIFSLEMLFKWLAFGMRRYFGNIWSWLDFLIVFVSFINLMASIFGSGKIQALKTMRTLRAMRGLRPLRALQRFQGMRVVVNALIQAIPSIFNVLLVCLIFWLIFSIMGVQMFGGKFWRCLEPLTNRVVSFEEAANKHECLERNLTWANPQINFDNVLNAYLALFQVATFKGWIDIMNSATDSRNRDDQPIREANIYMYFYFVFFVIFGSFFTLNLFIGVIIDNFNEQKKKTGGSLEIFMTEDQKKYYHAMKKMRSKRPQKAMTRPKFKFQAYMFDITTSKKFDMMIMLIIGINMVVMALEHYGQSQEFSVILENLNLLFIAIFTLECLCKIFAMRHFYFREPWNVFDFIVVNISILGVVMKEYVAKYFVSPTLLRVVRVVKVGRVLRLVKGAKGIRTLLFALAMSLPALFNICLLLFLVMFIYAIFGMSFFMNVRKRNGLDEIFNFETFTSSIIVLFQMSTSAGWDIVLDPLMDEENDCQKPDPVLGIEGTCGNRGISICYLISYVIITYLIIINMYIAVILENYSQATEDVQEGLTEDDYEMYYEIWQKFDPNGTQYLAYQRLSDFVDALENPLRIPKPNELALVILDINIYEGNRCYCVDILDALTKYFFTRKGLVIQVNEHLQKVQSTLHETPFERITTTFMLKREHYCAKLIQNCWRKWREKSLTQGGQQARSHD